MRSITVVLMAFFAMCGLGAAQEPRLPRVVLLGDSIRMGYAPLVEKRLAGMAIIVSPKANGGDSANTLKNLTAWAIRERSKGASRPSRLRTRRPMNRA